MFFPNLFSCQVQTVSLNTYCEISGTFLQICPNLNFYYSSGNHLSFSEKGVVKQKYTFSMHKGRFFTPAPLFYGFCTD